MEILLLRALERILVVLFGGLSIYLGYRLFLKLPEHRDSEGKIVLPGDISAYVSRVGPGVFFALFGTAVVGLSFHYGVTYEVGAKNPNGANTVFVGSVDSMQPAAQSCGHVGANERHDVERLIRRLNIISGHLANDLAPELRNEFETALRETKLRLLASVWSDDWAIEFPQFASWVRGGPTSATEEGLKPIIDIFYLGKNKDAEKGR